MHLVTGPSASEGVEIQSVSYLCNILQSVQLAPSPILLLSNIINIITWLSAYILVLPITIGITIMVYLCSELRILLFSPREALGTFSSSLKLES